MLHAIMTALNDLFIFCIDFVYVTNGFYFLYFQQGPFVTLS